VILAASLALIAIRAPHGHRSRSVKVSRSFKSTPEMIVLTLAWLGFFVPLIWVASPLFSFADYPLRLTPLVLGVGCYAAGLWLFRRSHADLGRFWSITLEVREGHRLITQGVYRRTRHPMYAAVFLYSIGQALALPNWFAGPSYLVVFGLLFAVRVGAEERMMVETFGDEYVAYRARTKRLIPGVW
jgi:protein-S-isoprenylcysteine O-methyltransferase Ste14